MKRCSNDKIAGVKNKDPLIHQGDHIDENSQCNEQNYFLNRLFTLGSINVNNNCDNVSNENGSPEIGQTGSVSFTQAEKTAFGDMFCLSEFSVLFRPYRIEQFSEVQEQLNHNNKKYWQVIHSMRCFALTFSSGETFSAKSDPNFNKISLSVTASAKKLQFCAFSEV